VLGAARNGAISGGLRRSQRSQGGAAARLFESMGEDAVPHSTASFYIFSLRGGSRLRYDPILRQLLMLPQWTENLGNRGKGMFGDRNADKNNANHGQRLVFAATEASCPTQPALQFCDSW
jgi:hypothetical protein